MASISSVLASLYSANDVVGVFTQPTKAAVPDANGNFQNDARQVFRAARPMAVQVSPSARLMKHPLENGAKTTDHIVFDPISINFIMIAQASDFIAVYQEIKQLYSNATLLNVQTKADAYENFLIKALPHFENAEMYNAIRINLQMEQVLFSSDLATSPQPGVPDVPGVVWNPSDQNQTDTLEQGQITPAPVTAVQSEPLSPSTLAVPAPNPLTDISAPTVGVPIPLTPSVAASQAVPFASAQALDALKGIPGLIVGGR